MNIKDGEEKEMRNCGNSSAGERMSSNPKYSTGCMLLWIALIRYRIKVEERNFRSKMLPLTFSSLSENLGLSKGQLSDLQLDVWAAIHAPSRRTDCAVASRARRQQDSRLNRPSLLTPLWQPCYNSLPESVAPMQCVNHRLLSFILSAGKEWCSQLACQTENRKCLQRKLYPEHRRLYCSQREDHFQGRVRTECL